MGKRNRQRAREQAAKAPSSDYTDADGNVLTLRGSLPPAARQEYAATLGGGLHREDALARATELLFERLAVAWEIAGVRTERQKELLLRYRMATQAERTAVREALRTHLAANFPEMESP